MDPKKEAKKIMQENDPPRKARAPHGKWVEAAKVVIAIVDDAGDKKWNLADAIRVVIEKRGYITAAEGTEEHAIQSLQAQDGIRAAYYMLRRRAARAVKAPKTPRFQLR